LRYRGFVGFHAPARSQLAGAARAQARWELDCLLSHTSQWPCDDCQGLGGNWRLNKATPEAQWCGRCDWNAAPGWYPARSGRCGAWHAAPDASQRRPAAHWCLRRERPRRGRGKGHRHRAGGSGSRPLGVCSGCAALKYRKCFAQPLGIRPLSIEAWPGLPGFQVTGGAGVLLCCRRCCHDPAVVRKRAGMGDTTARGACLPGIVSPGFSSRRCRAEMPATLPAGRSLWNDTSLRLYAPSSSTSTKVQTQVADRR